MKKAQICLICITTAFLFVLLGVFIGRNISDRISLSADEETESSQTMPIIDGKLDINRATIEQFDMLPGIGPVIAERIVAYRTENGLFTNIEQIMNVSGIGQVRFDDIKDYITIGGSHENSGS